MNQAKFREFLEGLISEFHSTEWLKTDPLEFVYHFENPWDQEVIAVLASQLAYGRVTQIRASIAKVIAVLNHLGGPAVCIRKLSGDSKVILSTRRELQKMLGNFKHRFNTGDDVVMLLGVLSRSWLHYGSLGAHYLNFPAENGLENHLNCLLRDWETWSNQMTLEGIKGDIHYFLSRPENGSACKRWMMFLRWMGRKDHVDPGIWQSGSPLLTMGQTSGLGPDQLCMPLDTHTSHLARTLGLTTRNSVDWKMVLDVTLAFREIEPFDPIRYDFALCRLGMILGK